MNGMVMLWVAIMVIGLIGMIVCSKKQKTNPAMQQVALLIFLVVIAAAVMLLIETEVFGSGNSQMNSELAYLASRGHETGICMKKIAPGKKVLVIAEPGYEKNEQTKNMIDIMKKAYGSETFEIDTLDVPGANAEGAMPLEELMKAKDFNKVLDKHKDAEVIVSLVGLPQDVKRMNIFFAAKKPAIFLLSTGMGTGKFIGEQIKAGVIQGVVVPKMKADYEKKAPKDLSEAFAVRFVMVNKDNFEANKQQFE